MNFLNTESESFNFKDDILINICSNPYF